MVALSQEEYDARFGESDYADMGAFDTDGDSMISEEEYNTGFFNRYDADQSGSLENTEMEGIDRDMGEGGVFNTDA